MCAERGAVLSGGPQNTRPFGGICGACCHRARTCLTTRLASGDAGATMRIQGWIRLWLVVTLIGVPIGAGLVYQSDSHRYDWATDMAIRICRDQEENLSTHPDSIQCAQRLGAYQSIFDREKVTPLNYWLGNFIGLFIADLLLTALLAAAFFVGRWVLRGFKLVVATTP